MDADVPRLSEILRQAFYRDRRYMFVRHVGTGAQGVCFKLDRLNPMPGDRRSIALKVMGDGLPVPGADTDSGSLPSAGVWADVELEALELMQGKSHVIQMIDILDDPLDNESIFARGGILWAYMEWLPNGTLGAFTIAANRTRRSLPNRLIWRIFLCLVRGVVACAWPDAYPAGISGLEVPQPVFSNRVLQNVDMHDFNYMFDAFSPTPVLEHDLAPPVKMIDLGITEIKHAASEDEWREHIEPMIRDIKEPLLNLAIIKRGGTINNATLDPDIRRILSDDDLHLRDIYNLTLQAVQQRDQLWYAQNMNITDDSESDDWIGMLVQNCILIPHPGGNQPGIALGF
ncbi:hypothetical protein AB5N19_14517 [Seiridium cardinale]